ncbi:MAG: Fe-S-cluster containining protein [Planctomycetota bacterium]|jgi:Fe-S-cluster containining protein
MPADSVSAVVPFTWACRRSGRCCSAPGGYVWVTDGEVDAMAAAKGLSSAGFRTQHMRVVPDPRPGANRGQPLEALAEHGDGRCTLLEGHNECSVYSARPEHCRAFPHWPSVLGDRAGFERARSTCPGIAIMVSKEKRELAFKRLDSLAHELTATWVAESSRCEVQSTCSRPAGEDSQHFVGGLEADWILARAGQPLQAAEPGAGCPWRGAGPGSEGRCRAGSGRPLTCILRAFGTNPTEREERASHVVDQLQALTQELSWPISYGRLSEQIASRRGQHGSAST